MVDLNFIGIFVEIIDNHSGCFVLFHWIPGEVKLIKNQFSIFKSVFECFERYPNILFSSQKKKLL